ncbi:MAG: hypothetical protein AAB511_00975 [Patescibacteria group bacterium]
MGNLEKDSRRRTRKGNIERAVLNTVAAAGVLSVALLAPNALKMLGVKNWAGWSRQKEGVAEARKRLIKNGLLEYKNNSLMVTVKGEAKLRHLELLNFRYPKPKRWDKKWRLLIFDIAESKRILRDKVRLTLQAIGFVKLQHSVWAYPYNCEDLIALLKTDFRVGTDLLYIIADNVENDAVLKKYFGLQ